MAGPQKTIAESDLDIKEVKAERACPCGSGLSFGECCLPMVAGKRPAPTAEALVRSRYTAFVMGHLDHVEDTHAPEIREDFNRAEAERLAGECDWQGLRIHKVTEDGDNAEVEYVIQVRRQGTRQTKASRSRFRREGGNWLFVASSSLPHLEHARSEKVDRNAPCPCGSGKKGKKCCGAAGG